MAREVEPIVVTQWALIAAPYVHLEEKRLQIAGLVGGKAFTSDAIVSREVRRTYKTQSGAIYRLWGPPEQGYEEFCRNQGIAVDWDDPIKFRDSVGEFEWPTADQSAKGANRGSKPHVS